MRSLNVQSDISHLALWSVEAIFGWDTLLKEIYETGLKLLRSCPEIVTVCESERFGLSYPEDQSVHQTIDACTLKLGATAVLHELGIWAWNTEKRKIRLFLHSSQTH